MIRIYKTPEFDDWFKKLQFKEMAQVEARLYRIEAFGHFGDVKPLQGAEESLFELRWKNGWRIYFYREGLVSIRLLLGGKKNDQKKDIKKARILLGRHAHFKKQEKCFSKA